MEIRQFNPLALYRALDEERARRGLSWSAAAREIGDATGGRRSLLRNVSQIGTIAAYDLENFYVPSA